ncbi:MAG TPA: DinB family protein [Thermoanaerobaculia bacterium]
MNAHLRSITEMNTAWFLNSVDGVGEEQAWNRTADNANSFGFVALHVANARYGLARLAGLDGIANPLQPYMKDVKTIDDLREQPTIAQIRDAWTALAPELHDYVAMVDVERPLEHRFPLDDKTVGGLLLFIIHHDGYHVGQLSMLRKTLGLSGTKLMRS